MRPMGAEVTVSGDGMRVWHLDEGVLHVCDVPTGQVRELATGIDDYGADRTGETLVWSIGGKLSLMVKGDVIQLRTPGPALRARPDPSGRRIGYLSDGTIRVIREDGS